MAKTIVINRHKYKGSYVYCGRGTPYGNRWIVNIHGTHDECVDWYEQEFEEKIKDPAFRAEVLKLKNKVIACSCKPKRCHLDCIAKWLNNLPDDPIDWLL